MKTNIDYEALAQALDPREKIPDELLEQLNTNLAVINRDARLMAKLAKQLVTVNGQAFCLLPFDHTLEAEGFGATIEYDHHVGSRVIPLPLATLAEISQIKSFAFDDQRVQATLAALPILQEDKQTVCFNVTGPASIAEMLLGSDLFFRGLMQGEPYQQLSLRIEKDLIQWLKMVLKHQVALISYADPTGDADILGPRVFRQTVGPANHRILQQVESMLRENNTVFHIHPALAASLLANGFMVIEKVFTPQIDYPHSILAIKNQNPDLIFISRLNETELVQLALIDL